MKSTLLLLISLLVSLSVYCQTDAIDAFYCSHRGGQNNISFKIGNSLLTIGSWFIEEPATRALVRKSKRARILISEDPDQVSRGEIRHLLEDVQIDGYESLALVKDGLDHLEIYVREDGRFIRNLLVIVQTDEELIMASLDCRISYDDLQAVLDENI